MWIVLIVLVWCLAHINALEEGEACELKMGQNGTCTNIHDCQYAKALLLNKQNPGVCGFNKNTPLVCCFKYSSTTRKPGVLSRQKCIQNLEAPAVVNTPKSGARASLPNEFPHMAIIGFGKGNKTRWLCGGSLISEKFVLTAAHCLRSAQFGNATVVRLGDLDITTKDDNVSHHDFGIKRLIPHPSYKRQSRYHDIGLIELDQYTWQVFQDGEIVAACLDLHREHNETKMAALGWGKTEFHGPFSDILLKIELDVIPYNVCRHAYEKKNSSLLAMGIIDDLQICAGGIDEKDTCQGDSGGPLQVRNRDIHESLFDIVGVTSFGDACGISSIPGIYTRVYNYISWIEDAAWPPSDENIEDI